MLKSIGRSILNRFRLVRAARLNMEMLPAMLMGQHRRGRRSWSEYGEDNRLVKEFADSLQDGYYVDVGANHPANKSNTYRLYNLGMRGILIEPNELLCAMHQRYRPGDLVINAAIGSRATAFYPPSNLSM